MKVFSRFCLFIMAAVLLLSCSDEEDEKVKEGDILPEFSVTLSDGTQISKSDFAGCVSLIVFFKTSCPDCREELPVIQQISSTYSEYENFRLVCIGVSENENTVKGYWKENGFDLLYAVPGDNSLVELFGFTTVPHLYLSDESCIVRHIYGDYPVASYETLSEAINPMLGIQ